MALEAIGLEAVLRDENFQAGVKRYVGSLANAESKTTDTASMMSKLSGIASGALTVGLGVATAAVGAATVALGAVAAVSKAGLDSLMSWGEQLDRLGDQFGATGEQASIWAYAMNRVGVSVEEGGAMLNFFTRQLDSTNALSKKGEPVVNAFTEAMDKLGIKTKDAGGKVKTFDALMPEIMDAFNKLPSGVEASALAMDMFGARGGTKFLDFLRSGSAGLDDAAKRAKELGLVLSTDGVNAIEEYGFTMNELNLAFTGVKNQIGAAVLPYAKRFIEMLVDNMPAIVSFAKVIAEGLGKAFEKLVPPILDFINAGGGLDNLIVTLKELGVTPEMFRAFATAREAILDLKEPLTSIGAWIMAQWPGISATFQTSWILIQNVVETVRDIFVSDVLPSFQEAFQNFGDAFAELGIDWADVWDAIKFAVVLVAKVVGAVLLALVAVVVGAMKGMAAAVKTGSAVWKEFTKNFKSIIEGVAKIFANWIEFFKKLFKGDFAGAFKNAGEVVKEFVKLLGNMFKQAILLVTGPLSVILDFVGGFVTGVIKFFENLYKKLVGGSIIPDMMRDILKVITDGLNAVKKFIDDVLSAIIKIFVDAFADMLKAVQDGIARIRDAIQTGFNRLREIINDVWTAIRNDVAAGWAAITAAIRAAIEAIPAAVAAAVAMLVQIGTSIVNTIRDGIIAAWNTAGGVVETLYNFLANLWSSVWNGDLGIALARIGAAIIDSIVYGLETAWDTVTGVAQTLWRFLADLINSIAPDGIIGTVLQIGAAIVDSIRNGIENAWDSFINWVIGMIGSIPSAVAPWLGGAQSQGARSGRFGSPAGTSSYSMMNTSNVTYNLYVSTSAPVSTVVSDFGMMRALAGV